jgi:glyoxylase-like metal-dependent hydrolase (beta-lactamase superfamily II)/8-oxo-dGTP pyrophosphatase MutT (NUDIX family)
VNAASNAGAGGGERPAGFQGGFHVPPPDSRPAASLLLLRDGRRDGVGALEVLMLRRAERAGDQRSGAVVFPGGVVDAGDSQAHAVCLGPDDDAASARLGVASGGLDYLVAAVRETFEEVGLLLASGDIDLAALAPWRQRLQAGQATLAAMCQAHDLRVDLRGLVYWSHWLTPPGHPKRFDTRFFAAAAPAGQVAQPDRGEAVELMWLTPGEALSRERDLKLLPVTRRTLQELAAHGSAAQALQAGAARRDIALTMPRRAASSRGLRVVLPDEPSWAEIGRLDPAGRGDVSCEIVAGRPVQLSPHIVRVTAPNPGVMTGPGTNSYLVGAGSAWTVIDPGPVSEPHLRALLQAVAALHGRIERILVTHTHRDHSPGAAALALATGAPVLGRRAAHPQGQDETFRPQRELTDGERLQLADGVTLRVIHTPGHASNHLCYLFEQERLLFTGDQVMQGSTVVINPPDGDMAAYLAALAALQAEDLEWLAPGHGFLIARPQAVLRALVAHRLQREARVLAALRAGGAAAIATLLPQVYGDVPVERHAMAQRSLLAHLLKLQAEGAASLQGQAWSAA